MRSVLIEDGRCDIEIRRYIGIAADIFRKLNTLWRTGKFGKNIEKVQWTGLKHPSSSMPVDAVQSSHRRKEMWY